MAEWWKARALALLVAMGVLVTVLAAPAQAFERVSVDAAGAQITQDGSTPSVSDDGRFVVFASKAAQLPGANGFVQIYRKDRQTGAVLLVSAGPTAAAGNGDSASPVISGDGSRVAWHTRATDLVASGIDTTNGFDVYAQDLDPAGRVGTPSLISATGGGTAGPGNNTTPSITVDGEVIVFKSSDPALVAFPASVGSGVVIWEGGSLGYGSNGVNVAEKGGLPELTQQEDGWLINKTCGGGANRLLRDVVLSRRAISDDGRYVTFVGGWCDLGAFGTSECFGTYYNAASFVLDRTSGVIRPLVDCQKALLAGHAFGTSSSNGISPPVIAGDGTAIATPLDSGLLFQSPGLGNVGALPIAHANNMKALDISDGGEIVSFHTTTALEAGDLNGVNDVYLAGSRVARASAPTAVDSDKASVDAVLTGGWDRLAFGSDATNLIASDTNGRHDVYTAGIDPTLGGAAEAAFSDPDSLRSVLPEETRGCNPMEEFVRWCSEVAGDPVDTGTGAFHEPFVDLTIPGRGGGLGVTRAHSSDAGGVVGAFGPGWASNLDMRVDIDGTGMARVRQEGGAVVRFAPYGGGFLAPKRAFGTLTKTTGGGFVLTRPGPQTITFDSAGRLTSVRDQNGHGTDFAYDTAGELATVTDGASRTLTVDWVGGRISQITDPVGRTVQYGYDGAGDLTSVIDVGGEETRYGYDGAHRMTAWTTPRQVADGTLDSLVNVYDGAGRVISQTDAEGRETTFDYTTVPGSTIVTDPDGDARLDTYVDGIRTSVTTAYGTVDAATWEYELHPLFKGPTRIEDPNGHVDVVATYDHNGNVASTTDALGRTSTARYGAHRRVLSTTDPTGLVTTYLYDEWGNVREVTTPLVETGEIRKTSYVRATSTAVRGDLTRIIDAANRQWNFTYDTHGLVASKTGPNSQRSTAQHDTVGRIQWAVTPKGNVSGGVPDDFKTTYVTDAFGRVTSSTDPLGHTSTLDFDEDGNIETAVDAESRTTTTTYDDTGLPLTVTLPDLSTTSTTYDDEGNVAATIDRAGRATAYGYDAADRIVTITRTDGRTVRHEYDGANNVVETELPGGDCDTAPAIGCTVRAYDDADQLTAIDFSDPATSDVAYTYDGRGELATFTDGTGTTTYTRDSLGRLITAVDGAGATTRYEWSLLGNLTATVYPSTQRVTRTYDASGRLATVRDWNSRTFTYGYDVNSNVTSIVYPTNRQEMVYDDADRLDLIRYKRSSTTLATIDLGMTDVDTVDSTVATGLPAGPTSYGYDDLDQLTGVDGDTYTYDLAENPTGLADGTRQEFDGANQLCFAAPAGVTGGTCAAPPVGATSYGYDSRGRRTERARPGGPVTTYGYDEADQLAQVSDTVAPTLTYTYDARGLRQTSDVAGVGLTRSTWSHNGSLGLLLTETAPGGGTTSYIYGMGTTPVAQYDAAGNVHFLFSDHIGSVRLTTGSTGTTTSTTTWDAYGNEVGATGTRPTRFAYGGATRDPETGLLYLRARYYDPETAQFLTRDPLELSTGSPYGYVGNSPLNGVDPTGMVSAPWDGVCFNNPFNPDDGCDGIAEQHPEEAQAAADFAGGVLDAVTWGQWRRSDFLSSRVDECSAAFGAGVVTGTIIDLVAGGKGAGRAGSRRVASVVDDAASRPRIFRAVEPDELEDLRASGQFRLGGWAEGLEGKYFWPTKEQADGFAELATKAKMGGPYCVASGCIPASVLDEIEAVPMDGLGPAYFIPEELLPLIDDIIIHG